ncbi:MAG: hypothetical protein V3W41_16285 [Planctomycetota bacterium]
MCCRPWSLLIVLIFVSLSCSEPSGQAGDAAHSEGDQDELSELIVLLGSDSETMAQIETVLKQSVRDSEGVTAVKARSGVPSRWLIVELDDRRLQRSGVQPSEILRIVFEAEERLGSPESSQGKDREILGNLALTTKGDSTLLLRDVARITVAKDPNNKVAWWQGKPVVVLDVFRRTRANAETRSQLQSRIVDACDKLKDEVLILAAEELAIIDFEFAAGTSIYRFNALAGEIEAFFTAEDSPLVEVDAKNGVIRVVTKSEAFGAINQILARLPGASLKTVLLGRSSRGRRVGFEIEGEAPAAIREVRKRLVDEMSRVDGVLTFPTVQPEDFLQTETVIDEKKAAQFGLTRSAIMQSIQLNTGGIRSPQSRVLVGYFGTGFDLQSLKGMHISTPAGTAVPLALVATMQSRKMAVSEHQVGILKARVGVLLNGTGSVDRRLKAVRAAVVALPLPEGLRITEVSSN